MVIDGPMDGELFLAWVEQFLCPTLQLGDIVILDNLSSHKVEGVQQAVAAAGAKVLYLPPYSPDLNPIEKLFSNSRPCSVKPPREPPRNCGRKSALSSTPSPPANARTTLPRLDMSALKLNML
jgi:hypothetical protein